MRITVGKNVYDVRFRQCLVPSKTGKYTVRQTTAMVSSVDPSKSGAKQYSLVDSVTLTQNVKDEDDKQKAKRMAISRLMQRNKTRFPKPTRRRLWRDSLASLL